jgi:hypothetical protein
MFAVLSKMPEQDRVFSNVQISCAHMNYMFFKRSAEAAEMIRESLEARRLKVRICRRTVIQKTEILLLLLVRSMKIVNS